MDHMRRSIQGLYLAHWEIHTLLYYFTFTSSELMFLFQRSIIIFSLSNLGCGDSLTQAYEGLLEGYWGILSQAWVSDVAGFSLTCPCPSFIRPVKEGDC